MVSPGIKTEKNKSGLQNILVIDDDEDILHTSQSVLRTEKYNVKSFSNPAVALMHFMAIEPYFYGLVIMDIRMPNMSGIQLYYKLKAIDPYINVLLVTALDAVKKWIDALPGIEIDSIVKKPVSRDEFIEKVRSMLTVK